MDSRLVSIVGDIVNEIQSAFVADRQILDGLFILNELNHWCKSKKKQSVIFKVDFEKAYPSVCWDYLDDVLKKISFDKRVVDAGMFKGVDIGPSLHLSHLFYADDAVFVGQWSDSNINNIVHVGLVVGGFMIASVRMLIDDRMLPEISFKTRRIKAIPIKVNVHAWKVSTPSEAQLSTTFYDGTCPNALRTIRTSIRTAISRERRMAASINSSGYDASILLDDSPTVISEKNALPNKGSVRGYEVIEAAKSEVEKLCPGVVSCADILTVAARDASEMVGGQSWSLKLGRRDSTTVSLVLANTGLPSFKAPLDSLISTFNDNGL
uniref:Peroxidase n=1 Tax=Tanacetum cinerariifolium TaxID=118510 RepID=A0A6L2MKQ6_TANCI|nr:lignin-forming anionic peroxidase-like [Tanacetum cinerariifolium]